MDRSENIAENELLPESLSQTNKTEEENKNETEITSISQTKSIQQEIPANSASETNILEQNAECDINDAITINEPADTSYPLMDIDEILGEINAERTESECSEKNNLFESTNEPNNDIKNGEDAKTETELCVQDEVIDLDGDDFQLPDEEPPSSEAKMEVNEPINLDEETFEVTDAILPEESSDDFKANTANLNVVLPPVNTKAEQTTSSNSNDGCNVVDLDVETKEEVQNTEAIKITDIKTSTEIIEEPLTKKDNDSSDAIQILDSSDESESSPVKTACIEKEKTIENKSDQPSIEPFEATLADFTAKSSVLDQNNEKSLDATESKPIDEKEEQQKPTNASTSVNDKEAVSTNAEAIQISDSSDESESSPVKIAETDKNIENEKSTENQLEQPLIESPKTTFDDFVTKIPASVNEKSDKTIESKENTQQKPSDSVDVFELMKENEHLFDTVDLLNDDDDEQQQLINGNADTTKDDIQQKQTDEPNTIGVVGEECINVDCKTNANDKFTYFYAAPEFAINHFHLKKRPKRMFICDTCFHECIEKYYKMCKSLVDKRPLMLENIKYSGSVEIIDSSDDEEDEKSPNECKEMLKPKQFDANTLAMIETNLEDIIKETLKAVDIKEQMEFNREILTEKIEKNSKDSDEIMKELKTIQKNADKMYLETYSFRSTLIEESPSLDLTTGNPTQICNESYPPTGELELPPLNSHSLYYSFYKKMSFSWHPCKFEKEIEENGLTLNSIKFLRSANRKIVESKVVARKCLAYGRPPNVRLNVGTRVIALCSNNESADANKKQAKAIVKNKFYPGVIAEPLKSYSNWRYLVFFDDGYVRYVHHDDVRLVCEQSDKVWELIDLEVARDFIEDYMKVFKFKEKRPIVQAYVGQKIYTECNGSWHLATVKAIEGSLVQMHFDTLQKYEWIYRGSTRLHPLFKRLNINSTNRGDTKFEYIVIEDDKEPIRTTETTAPVVEANDSQQSSHANRTFASQAIRDTPQQKQRDQKRAVAKKSTTNAKPTVQHMNNSTIYVDEDKPKGKVIYYTAKKHIAPKTYVTHNCKPSCLIQINHNLKTYSPLSKPLLSGWERQVCKTKFNKKSVVYRGPCGKRCRDMSEVHKYLRLTECPLNVENFDFDPMLHCLAEYVVDSFVMKKVDLSQGVEQMPVSCVNSYDNTEPPPCIYSNIRTPTDGVNLNLDPEFLCGCDCTDDCKDKEKCQCWQLTLAGAKYGNPDIPPDNIGYEYKRLYDHVPLGIYECNSRCKCKSNCLNRVVQHPLEIKLQVFKTVNRGWGIRCLNDIPRGCFVCCYAGNLLTEQNANDAGEHLGDEYFAELDYIEVVSNLKEGYESGNDLDVNSGSDDQDFDIDSESKRSENEDSDFDEFVSRSYSAVDTVKKRYRTRNSVDNRKKSNAAQKGSDSTKDRSESSDDEGEIRQQKNFMASKSMPDEPDDEQNKSIRALYGKDEAVYVMDAKKTGNIGRYFNHSCGPNLFVQNVFVDTHDLRFPWVAFFAISHIRAGTELTWNYNYEVGSVKGKVLICQCGDTNCRGRIL